MVSVPSTPKQARVTAISTPRTTIKRKPLQKTILTADFDESYMEDDVTYINGTSMISESDDESEDEDDDVEVEGDGDATETAVGKDGADQSRLTNGSVAEDAFVRFMKKHEVGRKLLHSSIGFFTIGLYINGVSHKLLIIPLMVLFAVVFLNDFIRFRNPDLNKKIVNFMWFMIREKEVNGYNGILWYLVGLIIVFSIFPKDISLMSVLLLSWADTAASTIGRQYGKYTPKVVGSKSLAGCIGSFLAGVGSCFLIYGYLVKFDVNQVGDFTWIEAQNKMSLPVLALATGFIASFAEAIDICGMDDNFTIPVLSSGLLYALIRATTV
jgi:diacylglycerol kinase (CTP)